VSSRMRPLDSAMVNMGNVSPSSGYCCPVANGARHRSRPLQPRF